MRLCIAQVPSVCTARLSSSSLVRLRKRDRPLPTHDLSSRTYDRIRPILLVEALVASVQKSRVHRVLGGGKLLH